MSSQSNPKIFLLFPSNMERARFIPVPVGEDLLGTLLQLLLVILLLPLMLGFMTSMFEQVQTISKQIQQIAEKIQKPTIVVLPGPEKREKKEEGGTRPQVPELPRPPGERPKAQHNILVSAMASSELDFDRVVGFIVYIDNKPLFIIRCFEKREQASIRLSEGEHTVKVVMTDGPNAGPIEFRIVIVDQDTNETLIDKHIHIEPGMGWTGRTTYEDRFWIGEKLEYIEREIGPQAIWL